MEKIFLSLGEVGIQPVGNVMVDHAPVVTNARQFKNDDAVVIIKDADGQQNVDDLGWRTWCLNNPDGLQGFAKFNSGSKRIE